MKRAPAAITLEEAWQFIGISEQSFLSRMPLFEEFAARFRPKGLWALPQEQIEAAKEIGRNLDLATIDDEKEPAIIMEYVAGGDLQALLETDSPLPLAQVLNIGLELADALSRAHHLGIIHRGLKPANVLLAEDGTPRLTDFGIARLDQRQTRLTHPDSLMGSPAYMSPDTPPPIAALLDHMLAKDPNARIDSMRQVAATLEKILADVVGSG